MAEETAILEPPPAEVASTTETKSAAINLVQEAFDRAVPLKPKKGEVAKPVEASKPTPEPLKTETPKSEPDLKPAVEQKLPSFVFGEKTEVKPTEPEIKLADLPKEPPATASENEKINWKKTRSLLEKQDSELKTLREKQVLREEKGKELSPVDSERLTQLETENNQLKDQFKRFGLQQDPTFIAQVIQPLRATYGEAKRIIKDAGGNPEQLDKALMLSGKAHYDAMDEILGEIPESAKGELTGVMRDYRRLATTRAEVLADAPRRFDELQKQNVQNQRQYLETQKVDMEKKFDERVKFLRDNAHLETLMESKEEGTEWWNEIPQKVMKTAKMIALENQDMDVVMDASILAASAITYRDLYRKSEERATKAEKELREIKGAEPRVTDAGSATPTEKIDPKEPFEKLFLRTLKTTAGR